MIQMLSNEFYENVQNELHYLDGGQNKVVSIFSKIKSTNNFGRDALIQMYTTDAVFMQDSDFTHTTPY
jgi:hypothetical protein